MGARTVEKVLIVGGGPGGLAAAAALRRHGIEPVVFERGSGEAGAGLTLWPNAFRALEALALDGPVRAASQPLAGMAMYTSRGQTLFALPAAVLQARFGGPGCTLLRAELVDVLRSALDAACLHEGRSCTGIRADADGVTAVFDDGSEARGDLLVGADGMRSAIRAQLFGPQALRYAGFTVWRGVAGFDLGGRPGATYLGRGLQFGLFALARRRVYWFASANAPEGEREARAGRKRRLLERFAGWPAPIPDVVAATDEAAILRNDTYDLDPLPAWSRGRVVLLGDAAHPCAPTLGQGACQALEDAVVLARCLRAYPVPEQALASYQARRSGRARAITLQSRQVGRTGQWRHPLACWLRDGLLRSTPAALHLRQLETLFRFDA